MIIGFNLEHFTYRGTSVAVFDYAIGNQKILGNKSIIFVPNIQTVEATTDVVKKFVENFQIYPYSSIDELEILCKFHKIDLFYTIKYGTQNELILKTIPTVVHCVYTCTMPHGDVYAAISESVAKTGENDIPIVPHIIDIVDDEKNLRKQLEIPDDAIIFGRHGGEDTFNIPFVKDTILKMVMENKNIYFIFAVKPLIFKDIEHPQIIYIDAFWNDKLKRRFINTCDAMIHASSLGESFGLSVLEFAACGKPIITWNGGKWHQQHLANLEVAKNTAGVFLYNDSIDLKEIFDDFHAKIYENLKELTEKFKPKVVMQKWKEIFIDSKKN